MRSSPAFLLIASFGGACLVGALFLALPASAAGAAASSFVDALFVSTSAVCVTGLSPVDTATAWSAFGQGVLLVLIQIGGLGILTFSTLIALLAGRRITLAEREVAVGAVTPLRRIDAVAVLRRIVLTTALLEALGAAALWVHWRRTFGAGEAAWQAVFHAVSAFCNAGFSTLPGGLTSYRGDLVVNLTVMTLIVAGGLGFVVYMDIEHRIRTGHRITLHTRVVLATTAFLLVLGTVAVFAFESRNTLAGLPAGERILASLFASVTSRTAGFNTLDYGSATSATLLVTMALMFVGGSPGSCAGGVKTTSLATLVAVAWNAMRGREGAVLFHRRISDDAVRQAQTLVLLSLAIVLPAVFLLHVSEEGPVPFHRMGGHMAGLAFESVSAFGTVGLSTGVTPQLSTGGKLLIIALMFVGRVGPLTLAVVLARKVRARYRYAKEDVLVG